MINPGATVLMKQFDAGVLHVIYIHVRVLLKHVDALTL